ncbi:MAG: hypothetical protein GWO20_12855, partial [Candidatus Korarchaeota archaeon]|nr:hypothetical protein [Candidatus Korarchaeota archaeon]
QGHIRLPNFMAGGFTLNWGRGTGGTNEVFSRPFTTVYGVVMSRYNSTADPEREAQPQNITTTGFLISTNGPAANNFWVAVGVS